MIHTLLNDPVISIEAFGDQSISQIHAFIALWKDLNSLKVGWKVTKKKRTQPTCNVFSMGTLSSKVSYIFLFLKADFNNMRRKVWRSMAQSKPSDSACIVAALQQNMFVKVKKYICIKIVPYGQFELT